MTISPTLCSSRSEEWPTPQQFFDALRGEFRFTVDPCATAADAKCATFFTKRHDGLARDWGRHRVFCNPPYGRAMTLWAHKCFEASRRDALVVPLAHARSDTLVAHQLDSIRRHVPLAHARSDTRWFHDWVYGKADDIRFVRGRLKFGDGRQSAPFPSLVAVFRPAPAGKVR